MQQTILLFLCSLFSLQIQAQQSILLKITPPGNSQPSYILASFEHAEISQYDVQQAVSPLISNVNTVVFDWLQDDAQREKMFEIMQMKEEHSLKKLYSREDNIRYELMVMDKLKSEVSAYAETQPLYTMQLFREKDFAEGVGYVNNAVFQLALQYSKPVISVLNARSVEEIVHTIDFDTQAKIVSNYINNAAAFKTADDENLLRYLNGDIQGITESYHTLQPAEYKHTFSDKKAELVFNKILLLSAQQSTFFVIDAELLGGESGIVQKLLNKGFSATSEYIILKRTENYSASSSENIQADNFPPLILTASTQSKATSKVLHTDSLPEHTHAFAALSDPFNDLFDYATADTVFLNSWYTVRGSDGRCNIKMPVQAEWQNTTTPSPSGDIKNYSYSGNHSKTDLYYSFGYTVFPSAFDAGNKTTFFSDFVKQQYIKLKGTVLAQRVISSPEFIGREFTIVVNDSFFVRTKVILKDNILYQLLCGGPGNNAYTAYADAYFRSFYLEKKIANNWFYYENNFFSCNLPTPPLAGSQKVNMQEGTLTLHTYSSEDYQEGISYLVSVFLYPPGYDFGNENNFLDELVKGAEKQYVGKAIQNQKVKKDGMTGRYVELQLNNTKIYKLYFFYRGNTVYQFLAGGAAASMQSENPQYFFNTFGFAADEK